MARNIEIKARIENVSSLKAVAAEIADQGPFEIEQDDTFFDCRNGRLKLRAFSEHVGELIFYRRADASGPHRIAIDTGADDLERTLAPLASDDVTTVIGFTERGRDGHLYNAAAVFARGAVAGIYRKMHPAINRSVYQAGVEATVFTVGNVTFGVLLCRDSVFPETVKLMVSRGAQLLLVPTNNGMPPAKGGAKLVGQARDRDVARAQESGVPVVRADVAGVDRERDLVSHGSSCIVNCNGQVLISARAMVTELVVGDIDLQQARSFS